MRLIIIGVTGALIYTALKLDSVLNPLGYWLTLIILTTLSLRFFAKFFTFLLTTTLLAYNFADLNSNQAFYSMILPTYIWLAVIALLITAIFTFPDILGQRARPSDPGSSIDSSDCGIDGGGGD